MKQATVILIPSILKPIYPLITSLQCQLTLKSHESQQQISKNLTNGTSKVSNKATWRRQILVKTVEAAAEVRRVLALYNGLLSTIIIKVLNKSVSVNQFRQGEAGLFRRLKPGNDLEEEYQIRLDKSLKVK